jgi:hypothetical protein
VTDIPEFTDPEPLPSGLTPGENMVLTIARAQLARGDNPPVNTTAVLVATIGRLLEEVRTVRVLAAERDELLKRVRDEHHSDNAQSPFCVECGHSWPCWTARAVNGGTDG